MLAPIQEMVDVLNGSINQMMAFWDAHSFLESRAGDINTFLRASDDNFPIHSSKVSEDPPSSLKSSGKDSNTFEDFHLFLKGSDEDPHSFLKSRDEDSNTVLKGRDEDSHSFPRDEDSNTVLKGREPEPEL